MSKREIIKSSIDARVAKFHLTMLSIIYLVLMISFVLMSIIWFWGRVEWMIKAISFFGGLYTCGFVMGIVTDAIAYNDLLKRSESYYYFTTVLKEPRRGGLRFYFPISFINQDGELMTANTESFFSAGLGRLDYFDWINKEVCVAYDSKKDKVIVIG